MTRSVPKPSLTDPVVRDALAARHATGLLRIASVINGNPDSDLLHGKILSDTHREAFAPDVDIATRRKGAATLACRRLGRSVGQVPRMRLKGIVCDGPSRNNRREFEFFDRICATANLRVSDKNYADVPRIRDVLFGRLRRRALLPTLRADLWRFYDRQTTISPTLVRQQMFYSRAFVQYALAFTARGAILPRALVQANDHSPSRVALAMVLAALGVPRVYLQHAEVSAIFPPLDMDYAVLRNGRSREIYAAIAPIQSRVFIIPRATAVPATARLTAPRGPGVPVVIYPTSTVLEGPLRAAIERLAANSDTGPLILKQHPRANGDIHTVLRGLPVTVAADVPAHDHIALVGNSSVAVELLTQGIPVYQNFSFDPIVADYYGMVRSGLTRAVDDAELSTRFWTPYAADASWHATFANWIPAPGSGDADTAAFVAAMAALDAGTEAPLNIAASER